MALNWYWERKVGTLVIHQVIKHNDNIDFDKWFKISLYKGNAFLIMLYEYEEDGKKMYSMHNFFVDKQHFQNVVKDAPQVFSDWKAITIDRSYYKPSELNTLINGISKCNPKCTIILKGENK